MASRSRLHAFTTVLAAALAVALAGACAGTSSGPEPAVRAASATSADVAMPSPARGRGASAAAANRECERCHADVAAEQRASLHDRAHDDDVYQRAFALEPLAFCTGCHAPEAPREGPVSKETGALGVGCVTCHLTESGAVLAAPVTGWTAEKAPHAVTRDPRFASEGACASCHEFEFPDNALRRRPELMQSTVTEHRASLLAGRSCADCHMPRAGARRSHAFAASRDEAFVRSAVAVSAERPTPTSVRVTLSPAAAGHAFPTGDLFRRVEVLAEVLGPEMSLVRDDVRYLARHFDNVRVGPALHRVLSRDDRVEQGPSPRVVDIDLGPEAAGRPIAFHVAYQRVQNTRSVDDRDAPLDGEVVLAQGTLSP